MTRNDELIDFYFIMAGFGCESIGLWLIIPAYDEGRLTPIGIMGTIFFFTFGFTLQMWTIKESVKNYKFTLNWRKQNE